MLFGRAVVRIDAGQANTHMFVLAGPGLHYDSSLAFGYTLGLGITSGLGSTGHRWCAETRLHAPIKGSVEPEVLTLSGGIAFVL